jgi:hypothetical protein
MPTVRPRLHVLAAALAWAGVAHGQETAPAPPAGTTEVRVKARRRDVGGSTMSREEAREVPGGFGDPARFVESMPGVVPTTSGLQAFYVRGAPPETTGYFIDGVPVPALYHIGFGPSVVHPGLVDRAELFPGAAPAYFGRAIGATIEEETAGPGARVRGEANLRLLDASALVEAPFGPKDRGAAEVSGRYGYPALVLPAFAPDVGLAYWDYQARVGWQLSDSDRIGAFVFGSNDLLTQRLTNGANIPYTAQLVKTEFHRLDLRYDHALGRDASLRVAGTLGLDTAGDEVSNVDDKSARLRAELDARLSRAVRVRAGADVQLTHYWLGASPKDPADPTPTPYGLPATPRDDVVSGVYADVSWRVSRHVELVPGVRADVFTSRPAGASAATSSPTIDPRLAARVTVAPGVVLVSTVGVAHQIPGLVVTAPDASPYLTSPGVERSVQTAEQLSDGVEIALPEGFVASVTGFLHHYEGLPDLTAPCVFAAGGDECVAQRVEGRAYGLELLVRRPLTERFSVLASYTLSRSERQAHSPYDPTAPVIWIPSEYDRTHVASLIASYDLGKDWRVGARVYGYTGRPYSRTYQQEPVPPLDTERLPGFWRLDVRVEKSWRIGERGRLAFVVEGMNVTLNKEAVDVSCTPRAGSVPPFTGVGLPAGAAYDTCTPDELGPITMPSVGVEGAF